MPILDPETIGKLRSLNQPGKRDLVDELSELFFNDSPALLETAGSALASEDYDGLYKAVHRLKGSALYIGGAELGGLCQELMAAARDENKALLQEKIPELKPAYERLSEALKKEIQ